ncbi:MAG: 2Fe-2S iron-sulfur cluster-binding protein [Verrucomicrobia bacterium]|nr:2Fe-2S iron-sulfur cluster-binding protein [Verrucomicrobiota bacterium]
MSGNGKVDMVTIILNGEKVEVPAGINLIEAAQIHGREVPHYCYHPKLTVAGNCRMCLVEMGMPMRDRGTGEPVLDADGNQKIGWIPKPVIGCGTNVAPGMRVNTDSPLAKDSREGIMEFLLVNHPLDCPICDQAGECRLQEFAMDYGRGYSRFVERKNVKPKRTRLGPRVTLDDERCILCSRCIRFCQEVAKDDVLGFVDRGSYSTLTCFPGKELSNNYSLNTVDICPVGALTSSDFRFKMRVWFLKESPSICTESSAGANTLVASREGQIYRITPRRNDAVNDTWMTDSGRELFKQVQSESRLTAHRSDGTEVTLDAAVARSVELLSNDEIAIVGSCNSSVEEQYLLRKLADQTKAETHLPGHFDDDDGLLLSADRTPNLRGALATGMVKKYPSDNLKPLALQLGKGEVKTLLVVNEDLFALGITKEQIKKAKIIYVGTHENETSKLADVVLPGLTVFEKNGTFINRNFRLQKFFQAVPGPAGLIPDFLVLNRIASELSGEVAESLGLESLWKEIGKLRTSCLKGIAYREIPSDGLALDPDKLADLPYVEGPALNFSPPKVKKAVKAKPKVAKV